MSHDADKHDLNAAEGPHFSVEPAAGDVQAWTEIEDGRFMPRRVRGSCQGRALG